MSPKPPDLRRTHDPHQEKMTTMREMWEREKPCSRDRQTNKKTNKENETTKREKEANICRWGWKNIIWVLERCYNTIINLRWYYSTIVNFFRIRRPAIDALTFPLFINTKKRLVSWSNNKELSSWANVIGWNSLKKIVVFSFTSPTPKQTLGRFLFLKK